MSQAMRDRYLDAACRVFGADPSIATVSIVSRALAQTASAVGRDAHLVQSTTAAWPACFINPAVAELLDAPEVSSEWTRAELDRVVAAATLRGLQHVWIVADHDGAAELSDLISPPPGDHVVISAIAIDQPAAASSPISLGIDAAWLLGGESGAQVFVFEMLRAMAQSDAISAIVLLSDSGGVPQSLAGVAKVSAKTWSDQLASGTRLDILHRPYQPGADTDFGRYRQVARAIALTVLDFIAYDNPSYHESPFAFREYQRAFDERVLEADQLFAISAYVGNRLQRQFAHRLTAPVRSILLGADHLDAAPAQGSASPPASLATVRPKQYLIALGNDFAHKNRDFAVKVFAEMCRRGYAGQLVLAGYHLDAGSSFGYELNGADSFADRVLRVGPLAQDDKVWALGNAEAVLYPTSSEGFGLIPFEAAALGTPAGFVRFGPLAETLPDVPAAPGWRVKEFADHVFGLIANPAPFIEAVTAARQGLTWQRCAEQTIATYRDMLSDGATWHAALARDPGPSEWQRATELMSEYSRRAGRKLARLSNLTGKQ